MANPTSHLFELIHSLTTSEKRLFKVLSKATGGQTQYQKLFDTIVKQSCYDEKELKQKLYANKPASALSNDKLYLEKLIFKVLRWIHDDLNPTTKFITEWHNNEIINRNGRSLNLYERSLYKMKNSIIKDEISVRTIIIDNLTADLMSWKHNQTKVEESLNKTLIDLQELCRYKTYQEKYIEIALVLNNHKSEIKQKRIYLEQTLKSLTPKESKLIFTKNTRYFYEKCKALIYYGLGEFEKLEISYNKLKELKKSNLDFNLQTHMIYSCLIQEKYDLAFHFYEPMKLSSIENYRKESIYIDLLLHSEKYNVVLEWFSNSANLEQLEVLLVNDPFEYIEKVYQNTSALFYSKKYKEAWTLVKVILNRNELNPNFKINYYSFLFIELLILLKLEYYELLESKSKSLLFSLKKETEFEDTNVLVLSITFLQKLSKKQGYQKEDIINMIQTIPDVYENGINFYLAKLNLKKLWAQFL